MRTLGLSFSTLPFEGLGKGASCRKKSYLTGVPWGESGALQSAQAGGKRRRPCAHEDVMAFCLKSISYSLGTVIILYINIHKLLSSELSANRRESSPVSHRAQSVQGSAPGWEPQVLCMGQAPFAAHFSIAF